MREIIIFCAVGVAATMTHYLVALAAVEQLNIGILYANVIAYCAAVGVSFFGHSLLTFQAKITRYRFVKFALVSLTALAVSQLVLVALTKIAISGHRINMLVVVGVVPIYSYVLNKFWVYKVQQ